MSREGMTTALVVTLITLLVWALAESQTLRTAEVETALSFDAGATPRALRVAAGEPWDSTVRVTVEGPSGAVDRVRRGLAEGVGLSVGVEIPDLTGRVVVDLAEAMGREEGLRGSGVRVVEVRPARVALEIEPVEERVLAVTVRLEAGEPDSPPVAEPGEVRVRGPASVIGSLGPTAVAVVPPAAIVDLRAGETVTVPGVPVSVESGMRGAAWGLRIEPAQISTRFAIRATTAQATLGSVPLEVSLPPDQLGRWLIEIPEEDRAITGVTVRGPATAVAPIGSGQTRVRAVLELTREDLERGISSKRVEFVGVPRLASASSVDDTIRLRIRPAWAPAPASAVGSPQPAQQPIPQPVQQPVQPRPDGAGAPGPGQWPGGQLPGGQVPGGQQTAGPGVEGAAAAG